MCVCVCVCQRKTKDRADGMREKVPIPGPSMGFETVPVCVRVCERERQRERDRERERERERERKRERERERETDREREREREPERESSQEFLRRVSNFPISDMVNVTRSTTAQFCFDILLVTKFIAAVIIPLAFACRRLRTELPNR